MIHAKEEKYFAASNGAGGFINYYHTVFDVEKLAHLYIIKGGPGTGKSSFMRDVANRAEGEGNTVVYFYCSSDPDSLDGILIKDKKIALLDGTAPHEKDPIYPGAREDMINLGEFWDSDKLARQFECIKGLNEDKKRCYINAYSYLTAYAEQAKIADRLLDPCVLRDKMKGAVDRLMRSIPDGASYEESPYLLGSVGMRGRVCFDTYREMAGRVYTIRDTYHTAHAFLRLVREAAREKGLATYVSYHPVLSDRIEALFFPDHKIALVIGEGQEGDKLINMRRFLDWTAFERRREGVRFAEKSAKDMMAGACYFLKEAAHYHYELERIYTAAMDFDRKERYTAEFIKQLFG